VLYTAVAYVILLQYFLSFSESEVTEYSYIDWSIPDRYDGS